jgi:hypothetical protein
MAIPDGSVVGLVVFLIGVTWFLAHQGRGTTFFYDEWTVWASRFGAAPSQWLTPINGHLSAVPILAFTTITKVWGAESLVPFRVAAIGCHVVLLTLMYVVARRRLGGSLALVAVLPLGVVAAGWLDLMMPFTAIFAIGPLIAALVAYLCLERGNLVGDLAACVALGLGIATAGGGLAVLAGFGIYLLLTPPQWRRLWVVGVPLVLYLLWRARYHPPNEFAFADLGLALSYVVRGLASGLGAYTTLGTNYGRILAVGVIGGWIAVVMRRGFTLWRGMVTFAAIGAGYWVLIAIARGPALGPEEIRYVYVNAFLAVLIVIGLVPLATAPLSIAPTALVGAIALLALFSQIQTLRGQAASYRETSAFAQADVFAINTAAKVVTPGFTAPGGDPQLSAGSYLHARRYWGGPAGFSEQQVRAADPKVRDHVDTTLVHAFALSVSPLPSLRGVRLAALERPALAGPGQAVPAGADCWAPRPASAGSAVSADLRVSPRALGGIVVVAQAAPVQLVSGRYYDQPMDVLGSVAAHGTGAVALPPDDRTTPWTLRVNSAAGLRVCGLAR